MGYNGNGKRIEILSFHGGVRFTTRESFGSSSSLTDYEGQRLLSALVSNHSSVKDSAAEVISKLPAKERWKLGQDISQFDPSYQPSLRKAFKPFNVGVHFDDFALPDSWLHPPRSHTLFEEGERGDVAYAVFEGGVQVFKNFFDLPNRRLLHTYRAGTIVGDYALLLDNAVRTATAVTLPNINTRLAELSRDTYLRQFGLLTIERQLEQRELIRAKLS